MRDYLLSLVSFNAWANKKIWEELLLLSEVELNKDIPSSFPSIIKTVKHIFDAECAWYSRIQNTVLKNKFGEVYNGSFPQLIQEVSNCSKQWIDFVEASSEMDLTKVFKYKRMEVEHQTKMQDAIIHFVNHGTYHRGQLVTMLRQLGITKIPSTDFITYCRLLE
ncbi:MAG: DinB family protein [Saprospiraceae bacterium]